VRRPSRLPLAAGAVVASPILIGTLYSTLAALGLAGAGARGLTLANVSAVLASAQTWRGIAWTLATAGVATLLASAAALFVALRVRDSRTGQLLAVLPMAVLLVFGQSGLLSRLTHAIGLTSVPADFPALVYDPLGVSLVIAFAWKEFPYLALTALAVLLTGSVELEEVARTLGATSRQAFWRVTWPWLWRGASPAVLAAFAFLVGQYEMPALLAPSDPTALPLLTYERSVDPDLFHRGEAHVLALLALGISALVVLAHSRWRARTEPTLQ
jgi:putative spermidine/putrescine transport system permease protein